MKKVLLIAATVICVASLTLYLAVLLVLQDPEFGGAPLESRADLLRGSEHFVEGGFQNSHPPRPSSLWINIKDRWNAVNRIAPAFPITKPDYTKIAPDGLHATWFGHASVLVEIDGFRIFFDPMLSNQAFPVDFIAPKRMNPTPLNMKELPKIDAVIVSHDHYDHLDMKSIQHLARDGAHFYVGLGIGAHLEKWDVPLNQIHEMDWGQTQTLRGLSIHCHEARHYSGRKAMDNSTLWASWVVRGPKHQVYHSGDSGYGEHFKQVGSMFPGIDLALIKIGDYGLDAGWQDIHMVPEHSVQAHVDLGAKIMLPIHWGVFALSNHPWNEPIERALRASSEQDVKLITPKIGDRVDINHLKEYRTWWREL